METPPLPGQNSESAPDIIEQTVTELRETAEKAASLRKLGEGGGE